MTAGGVKLTRDDIRCFMIHAASFERRLTCRRLVHDACRSHTARHRRRRCGTPRGRVRVAGSSRCTRPRTCNLAVSRQPQTSALTNRLAHIFAARCYVSARPMPSCGVRRLSVTLVDCVKTNKYVFKIVSPSSSHTM